MKAKDKLKSKLVDILHIHRYLSNEASAEEKRELEHWLDESQKNKKLFESCRKIYNVELAHSYSYDVENALQTFRSVMDAKVQSKASIKKLTPVKRKTGNSGLWLKVAAVLVIAIGLSIYAITSSDIYKIEEITETLTGLTIDTAPGEQKSFRLKDGTRIRLNASSSVYIPSDFGIDAREVELQGEAFFEVANNTDLEFSVETDAARIAVLGTSFSVRAWMDRDESVVAVQTGKVMVRSVNPEIEKQVTLNPGEYSQVRIGEAPGPAQRASIEQFFGWTNQMFVFEETPLKDVLHQLELHFNVIISVVDSSSINEPVTARYRNESLDEILTYTSITHGVTFNVESLNNNN